MIQIKLPLPNPLLYPNRKNGLHWSSTLAAKNVDKKTAYYLTLELGAKPFTTEDRLHAIWQFVYNDKRHRDCDNMLAASKAMQDGVCDALCINDRQIDLVTIDKRLSVKTDGYTMLIITKYVERSSIIL